MKPVEVVSNEIAQKFYLEEAKMFTNAVWDIDKLIGQIFGATIAVAITLLSVLAKSIFEDQRYTLPLAYATLAPNVISLVAFYYLLSQRRSLVEVRLLRPLSRSPSWSRWFPE